jgi:hypothetical protein
MYIKESMEKTESSSTRKNRIDFEAFSALKEKFALIDDYIERGEGIPKRLTKNFVTFPLSDNLGIE